MAKLHSAFALLALSLAAPVASANSRCDCNEIVGSCTASISLTGKWFQLRSNTPRCSRVSWHVGPQPRTDVVLDGEELIENLGSTPNEFSWYACDVCCDKAFEQREAVTAGTIEQREAQAPVASEWFNAKPIYRASPAYPPRAQARGIEGYATVSVTVRPDGSATNPRVVDAQPADVFDAAALAAISQWRFEPSRSGGTKNVLFRFKLAQ